MLSKLFGFFKSKPVEKQPEPVVAPLGDTTSGGGPAVEEDKPLVKLGPEKEQLVTIEYELLVKPTPQQLEDAFKEEEKPKYEKDDGALSERQLDAVAASVPETKPPVKKRTATKTPAKKVVKNGKSKS